MTEIPSISLDQLKKAGGGREIEGAEKTVIAVTDGRRLIAAKLFHDRDHDGVRIDKPRAATSEFNAYLTFRQTSLRPYIPEAYFLIKDKQGIAGLAVEWREGSQLNLLWPRNKLLAREIDELETACTRVTGAIPGLDMLQDLNICFRERGEPRMWFAECFFAKNTSWSQYRSFLTWAMDYLRQGYVAT